MVRKIFPDDIRTFIFEATPVRTISIDGGIWFGAWDLSLIHISEPTRPY